MSWHRILVAVPPDGTIGQVELNKMAHLALSFDAELELFETVYSPGIVQPARMTAAQWQQEIQNRVQSRREQLEPIVHALRIRGVRAKASARWDDPLHEGIVRQTLRHESDLLIVPFKLTGRGARALFTRTDYKLIETCPCPVLFLKTARPYLDPVIVAAVDPQGAHGKPASLDDAILEAASVVSRAVSGKLFVCHAYAPWEQVARKSSDLRDIPEPVSNDVHAAYTNQVASRVLELARRHRIPEGQVQIIEAQATEAILQTARRRHADVVVVGAVSRSRLRRFLVGHTSERVLDPLECDVLIVKPQEFRTAVAAESMHHFVRRVS